MDKNTGKISLAGIPYQTKITDHYKSLDFPENLAPMVGAILNSSFAYWWFVLYSDGRDLLSDTILSMPIDLTRIPEYLKSSLTAKSIALMEDFERNSNLKVNIRKGGYAIKIKEIIPKKSVSIISDIDNLISVAFSLTVDESEFIKSFDLGFRMGNGASEE
ncbi:MAG: hypothetical protein QXU18_03740 [Thermoplasmatales archaeon]